MAALSVSDHRSNPNDQIVAAVKAIGRSSHRLQVFEAVYGGKRRIKTVDEIASSTGLKPKDVLGAGHFLSGRSIIHQIKVDKRTAYEKDDFFATHKKKIISLVKNPKGLKSIPTKSEPISILKIEKISVPGKLIKATMLTIDEIESLKPTVPAGAKPVTDLKTISEDSFKKGIQKLIGDTGVFKDWGGEVNDLLTTKVKYKGKSLATAFAFKGPGKRGKLTPAKMGKNGDQIQRLYKSPANLFILQYWSQIDQSVFEQMQMIANLKSILENEVIYFCVIDGHDTQRIVDSHPTYFV